MKYLLLISVLLLSACSEDGDSINGHGGSGDPYTRRAVGYDLNANPPTCYRPSNYQERKNGSSHIITCEWYCALDNTYNDQYVMLEFMLNGGRWVENRKVVSGGRCNI